MQELVFPPEFFSLVAALVSAVLRLEPQLQPGVARFVVNQFVPTLARQMLQLDFRRPRALPATMPCEITARCPGAPSLLLESQQLLPSEHGRCAHLQVLASLVATSTAAPLGYFLGELAYMLFLSFQGEAVFYMIHHCPAEHCSHDRRRCTSHACMTGARVCEQTLRSRR
jgi:hypothetical protein